jgi:hypothetical protein
LNELQAVGMLNEYTESVREYRQYTGGSTCTYLSILRKTHLDFSDLQKPQHGSIKSLKSNVVDIINNK